MAAYTVPALAALLPASNPNPSPACRASSTLSGATTPRYSKRWPTQPYSLRCAPATSPCCCWATHPASTRWRCRATWRPWFAPRSGSHTRRVANRHWRPCRPGGHATAGSGTRGWAPRAAQCLPRKAACPARRPRCRKGPAAASPLPALPPSVPCLQEYYDTLARCRAILPAFASGACLPACPLARWVRAGPAQPGTHYRRQRLVRCSAMRCHAPAPRACTQYVNALPIPPCPIPLLQRRTS